ncbi:MAG: ROK family protein [Gammaproteobacteria bacterium]|nr:ROK family protein [Gammaproteobacteria bacterium]MDH5799980.1 ROK family protein [Gammaproteobacteria bacterium]
MSKQQPVRIGVDLGGTKTEIIALSPDGEMLTRKRVASPQGDYEATVKNVVNLVRGVEAKLGLTQEHSLVGIGTPGAVSKDSGLMKNSNSTWLNGRALKRDIQLHLQRPVRLENDANCFVLSEATDGAAKGASVVFGVIMGTGTGGGLVVNGQVVRGCNLIAGEWGHNPLPWPGPDEQPGPSCYCGKQGCIETFLSGPGMQAQYRHVTGTALSAHGIVAQAADGDELAETVLQDYERRLAKALASVINVVDPDVIVLGGGMSNIERLYTRVPLLWGEYVFSDVVATVLKAPIHGDSSGVRGAAWLWG